MGDGRDSPAPRHPSSERRSLVLWAAAGGAGADPALIPRDVVGTLALPLHGVGAAAARDASLAGGAIAAGVAERARAAGLGLALAPQAWRNQLDPDRRGAAFALLPYAQPDALELEAGALGDDAARDYADAVLDAQLAAGATLATTPAHVFEREHGAGRDNDLLLASATVAAWRERQGWRPPPQRPATRRASCTPRARRPRPSPARGGSAAGRALPRSRPSTASGSSCSTTTTARTSARVAEGVTALALGLQAGGRPVVVAGAGAWHAALLASGVAATCAGADGAQPTFPPDAAAADGVTGIGVQVFHQAILGSAPLGAAPARRRASGCSPPIPAAAASTSPTSRRAAAARRCATTSPASRPRRATRRAWRRCSTRRASPPVSSARTPPAPASPSPRCRRPGQRSPRPRAPSAAPAPPPVSTPAPDPARSGARRRRCRAAAARGASIRSA